MYNSSWARKQVIYLNYVKDPFTDYSKPYKHGIENSTNFYINGPAGKLGAWYVKAKNDEIPFDQPFHLTDGNPVFIYFHGNAFSRANEHRLALYKVLSSLSYHVVTIDYRGFADSDGHPSEQGLIEDGLATWDWVKSRSADAPVFIWGHSLGSAVAAGVAKVLCDKGSPPSGIILEAPFNNVYDAGKEHAIAKPFRFLPFFEEIVMDEVKQLFRTDKRISHIYCPILMLHDQDDEIIPFKFGKKLYVQARQSRPSNAKPVHLIEFNGKHGHNWICDSKLLPRILRDFLEQNSLQSEQTVFADKKD
ncbi:lysophosphatidylserine lipase ABHD12-like isoform X2 [Actinia tenebrosa]|nr:lysophosphatidylserine lipase ABHD12-like isoform X2 [Actinia tenebrosa]